MSQGYTRVTPIDNDGTLSANSDFLIPSQKAVKTYVDTGLATKQNTLVGNESVLLPNRIPFKQNTTISHTGAIIQTVVFNNGLISAGTFEANDFFNFNIALNCTNNANVKTVQAYFNTTNDLVGSPILVASRSLANTTGGHIDRTMAFNNSLSSQKIMIPSASVASDKSTSQSTSTIAINFAVDQYFIIAITLATGTDTVSIQYLKTCLER